MSTQSSVGSGKGASPAFTINAFSRLEVTVRRFNREKLELDERANALIRSLKEKDEELQERNAAITALTLDKENLMAEKEERLKKMRQQNSRLDGMEKQINMLMDGATTYDKCLADLQNQSEMFSESNNQVKRLQIQLHKSLVHTKNEKEEAYSKFSELVAASNAKDEKYAALVRGKESSDAEFKQRIERITDENSKLIQEANQHQKLIDEMRQKLEAAIDGSNVLTCQLKHSEAQLLDVCKAKDETYAALVEVKEYSDAEFKQRIETVTDENSKLLEKANEQQKLFDEMTKKLKAAIDDNNALTCQLTHSKAQLVDVSSAKDEKYAALVGIKECSDAEFKRTIAMTVEQNSKLLQEANQQQKLIDEMTQKFKAAIDDKNTLTCQLKQSEEQLLDVSKAKDETYAALLEVKEFADAEFKQRIEIITDENSKLKQEANLQQKLLDEMTQKLKAAIDDNNTLKCQLTHTKAELVDVSNAKDEKYAALVGVKDCSDAEFKQTIAMTTQENSKLLQEANQQQKLIDEMTQKLKAAFDDNNALTCQLNQSEAQLRDVSKAKDETYATLLEAKELADVEFKQRIEMITNENSKLLQEANQQQKSIDEMTQKLKAAFEDNNALTCQLNQSDAQLSDVSKAKDETYAALLEAKELADVEFKQRIEMITNENSKLLQEANQQQKLVDEMTQKMRAAIDDNNALTCQLTQSEAQLLDVSKAKDAAYAALVEVKEFSDAEYKQRMEMITNENSKLLQEANRQHKLIDEMTQKLKAAFDNNNALTFQLNQSEAQLLDVSKAKDETYAALLDVKDFSDAEFKQRIELITDENSKLLEKANQQQKLIDQMTQKMKDAERQTTITSVQRLRNRFRQNSLPRVTRGAVSQHYRPTSTEGSGDESSTSDIIALPFSNVVHGISAMRVQSPPGKRYGQSIPHDQTPTKKSKVPETSVSTPGSAAVVNAGSPAPVRRFFKHKPLLTSTPKASATSTPVRRQK